MNQYIDLTTQDLTERELSLILLWKKQRYNNDEKILTIGECIAFLVATTTNLHSDDSDGRFFNNILQNDESIIAWDGEVDDFIGTLFFEVKKAARRRLVMSRVFPE